jgi:hypothetical protein
LRRLDPQPFRSRLPDITVRLRAAQAGNGANRFDPRATEFGTAVLADNARFPAIDNATQGSTLRLPCAEQGQQRLTQWPFSGWLIEAVAPPGEAQLNHQWIATFPRRIGKPPVQQEQALPQGLKGPRRVEHREPFGWAQFKIRRTQR